MNQQLPKNLLQFVFYFLKPHPWGFAALVLFSVISGVYGTINAYLLKVIIDHLAWERPAADLWTLLLWPSIFFVVNYELHNFSWRGIQYMRMCIGLPIQNQMIKKMFAYAEGHAFQFFQNNFSGTLASNISSLADNIFIILTEIIPFVIRQTVQTVLALLTMLLVSPYFFLVFLIWIILFLAIGLLFSKKTMQLSNRLAEEHAKVSGKITDSISNANNVRLFAREAYEVNYLNGFLQGLADRFRKKEWFVLQLSSIQSFSITILMATILLVLIKLRMNHLVTIGDFAFILSLSLYVTEGVWYLMEHIQRLNDLIGRAHQSINMILVPKAIVDIPNAEDLKIDTGEIVFDNVCFQYQRDKNLFENQSVRIPGGQRVGLVGLSGSGKTTFVHLIARLFDLSSGAIRIDNQDIKAVTQSSLRENIGFIAQDPILFHRTLMENIRYGNIHARDEEVIQAAIKAHAHEFICLTVDGYQSMVGERGIKLSGGQRQRISIARALLKNAPILILDEATSALDSITEAYIQESMSMLMQGKTVIVVAHRLSTLLEMDRILVFDQGKIVEDGTHSELLAKNGRYKMLWGAQVGGFLLDADES